jgi:hypothetical protein
MKNQKYAKEDFLRLLDDLIVEEEFSDLMDYEKEFIRNLK